MDKLYKSGAVTKRRPYWHVDLKWICGLFLALSLMLTLPTIALYQLTQRDVATKAITYTLAGLTSPKGIDNIEGLEEIKAQIARQGPLVLDIGGAKVTFTAEDLATLSPRELRLKAFGSLAADIYDKGPYQLALDTGSTKEEAKKFESDATILRVFTRDVHEQIGQFVMWMILANVLLLALVVLFSYRFGRLVSPGVILSLIGLPALPLLAAASQNGEPSGSARSEEVTSSADAISNFGDFVAPLLLPPVSRVYAVIFFAGIALLAAGGIGKLIYILIKKRTPKTV